MYPEGKNGDFAQQRPLPILWWSEASHSPFEKRFIIISSGTLWQVSFCSVTSLSLFRLFSSYKAINFLSEISRFSTTLSLAFTDKKPKLSIFDVVVVLVTSYAQGVYIDARMTWRMRAAESEIFLFILYHLCDILQRTYSQQSIMWRGCFACQDS